MYLMTNSADPDQLASEEANWSVSTLFAKVGHGWDQQGKVKAVYISLMAFDNNNALLLLTLSTMCIFNRQYFEIFFLFFPENRF